MKNPKQAIAIGLSEARKAGAKIPPSPNQKAAAEAGSAKQAGAKKSTTKKSNPKKGPAKKASQKKTVKS